METPRVREMQMPARQRGLPRKWWMLVIAMMFVVSGCAANKQWKYLPATKAEERSVYVVAHGWHTGIALSKEDLGQELAFVAHYLPPGRYYEFGWGEAEFYQADKPTALMYLKAIFWRNPSVMHVVSVPSTPEKFFTQSEVIELNLSETGLKQVKDRLRASFDFESADRPFPLKKGPTGENRFFKGEEYYVITNTCNKWTASILESGGVPMDTVFTLRAAAVMRQVKEAKQEYLKLRPVDSKAPQSMSMGYQLLAQER